MNPRILSWLLWLVAGGVLLQAVLAGQGWFVSPELITVHGFVGHGVLLVGLVAAALSWRAPVGRAVRVCSALVVLALVAQIGLGYTGHRSGIATASSLHVPLGVAIVALTVAGAVLAGVAPERRR